MKNGRQISVLQANLLPSSPLKMEAIDFSYSQSILTRVVSEWAKYEYVVIYRFITTYCSAVYNYKWYNMFQLIHTKVTYSQLHR